MTDFTKRRFTVLVFPMCWVLTVIAILIVVLLVVLLLLIPLIAWMYVDVRQMELRVNKALTRIEGK